MIIRIDDRFLAIIFEDKKEEVIVKDSFTWKDVSKAFNGQKFDSSKIKTVCFLEKKKNVYVAHSGFLKQLLDVIRYHKLNVSNIKDLRTRFDHQKKKYSDEFIASFFPFDYNDHQVNALKKVLKTTYGIVKVPTGGGKCFGKNTKILMHDGSIKKVQDIIVGDRVLGIDGKSKRVLSLARGEERLYKIIQNKGREYVVNESHVLSLKITNIGNERALAGNGEYYRSYDTANISVRDYIKSSKNFKHISKGWSCGINLQEQNVKIDPYFLGIWLGDGASRTSAITTMDEEIVEYLKEFSESRNLLINIQEKKDGNKAKSYYITAGKNAGRIKNSILNDLKEYNLINNKHIPENYKFNDRGARLQLLAGFIDTDGHLHNGYYEIVQKSKRLTDDILFLARSLGFYCNLKEKFITGYNYPFYRISICGEINEIPCKIKRKIANKRVQKKNINVTGLKVEGVGKGEYYGFEIEVKSKLFFLDDFTVVHNSEVMLAFIKIAKLPTLILVNKIGLCDQLAERAEEAGIESVGIWHSKKKKSGDVQFATIGSVKSLPSLSKYKILIGDEVHHFSSKTFQDFLSKSSYPIRIGFSATPDKDDPFIYAKVRQYFGNEIAVVSADELIENKVIALPKITFLNVDCPATLDWKTAYEQGIIKNKERNKKIVDIVEKYEMPTLILIKDVKHKQGEIIKSYIEENTHKKVVYIHGSSKHNRMKVIHSFENGEIDVLISTNILNEGISMKKIKVLINASGGKSKVENLQKLGRGVRIDDGKSEVIVYDFDDNGNKFTERHSAIREKLYKKEGYQEIEHIDNLF